MARGRKRRSSQSDLDAAVDVVVAGASYALTEKMTGVAASTVRDYVVRCGLVRRSVPGPGRKKGPSTRMTRALEALSKGPSLDEAAGVAGIAVSTLRRYLGRPGRGRRPGPHLPPGRRDRPAHLVPHRRRRRPQLVPLPAPPPGPSRRTHPQPARGRAIILHRRTPPVEAVLPAWMDLPCAPVVKASLAQTERHRTTP
jgi:hypothetical protein